MPLQIVVVDDEQIVALDIRRTLERLGYVVPAMEADADAAIATVTELRPDLVLMDIRLRRGDGIDAAKHITEHLGIPVIFLTAFSDKATLARAMKAAPFGFLIKPFAERELHSCIEIALLKHQAECELDEARRLAEHASLAKTSFLAGMSHEIRNTLNGIVGMTDLVLDTPLLGEQRENLNTVMASSETLLTLLHDVLDFARLEARQLRLVEKNFSLRGLVKQVTASCQATAERKNLELITMIAPDVPDTLVGDPTRITQVLANLVGNALKFTHEGSITIGVTLVPQDQTILEAFFPDGAPSNHTLLFSVRDTGIGISASNLEVIFDAFSQGSAETATTYGGTGLGLAICRDLTEMMGGSIWARSKPGEGSSFHFTCRLRQPIPQLTASPAQGSQHAAPEAQPRVAHQQRSLHLLVVDDDPVACTIICRLLRKRGHSCEQANDGVTALQHLTSQRFDLVLLDIKMHPMTGLELLRRIRNSQHPGVDRNIPCVAVTAHALKGDRERFLMEGMTDYIAKPVTASSLYAMLDRVIATIPARSESIILDVTSARVQHQDNMQQMIAMWHDFCDKASEHIIGLLDARDRDDNSKASFHAGMLHTVAERCGAHVVANQAGAIRRAIDSDNGQDITLLVNNLEQAVTQTIATIRHIIDHADRS